MKMSENFVSFLLAALVIMIFSQGKVLAKTEDGVMAPSFGSDGVPVATSAPFRSDVAIGSTIIQP